MLTQWLGAYAAWIDVVFTVALIVFMVMTNRRISRLKTAFFIADKRIVDLMQVSDRHTKCLFHLADRGDRLEAKVRGEEAA